MKGKQRQPNIILIFTDQHRLSGLGCYGKTPCLTPNIDRLSKQGVRFETAYTACPVCSPARASIMTGLHVHGHGICSNVHELGCSIQELADRPELLSRRLINAGYQCGYTGKWHLGTNKTETFGGPNNPSLPKDVGFQGQNFPGHGYGGFGFQEYKEYCTQNGFVHKVITKKTSRPKVMPYGLLEGPVESTVPFFLTEHTINLIDQFHSSNRPFFIWHNFWGPHSPYYSTQEFYNMYKDVEIPKWPNFEFEARSINRPHRVKLHPKLEQLNWEDWAEGIRHYYAFVSLIDGQVGRILDHVENRGIAADTIIIFSADHGETLGSHGGLIDKGWNHFEEIQRIPLIIKDPRSNNRKTARCKSVQTEPVSLIDLYPTILDLADAEYTSTEIHGKSLYMLLNGRKTKLHENIYVEFNGVNSLSTTMITCRHGNLKYGWNCSSEDELYDLSEDPHEVHNLIDHPSSKGEADEMRGRIEEFMKETDHPSLFMYQKTRMGYYPY